MSTLVLFMILYIIIDTENKITTIEGWPWDNSLHIMRYS